MAQSTFSLSWEAHRNNICNGLSALQQNEEFVDMTLAADGHFVKVHQMVMALASPYFKALISSAGGRHPVVYLNKISYSTLSAILEYIYKGEVLITIENLSELIETAKELHIKGLENMNMQNSINTAIGLTQSQIEQPKNNSQDRQNKNEMDDDICYFEITDRDDTQSQISYSKMTEDGLLDDSKSVISINVSEEDEDYEETLDEESEAKSPSSRALQVESCVEQYPSTVQFTVSNQGSLQLILNRYIYYLKYSNQNHTRQWRCVDYLNKFKCPAIVSTRDNMVLQRLAAHTHPHHDKRILKKIQAGAVYTAIKEAERDGFTIKTQVRQEKMERDPTRHIDTKNTTKKKMPLTPAEKSKHYRDKLKLSYPEKYEDLKKKNKDRAAKYYRTKIISMTDAQREEMRLKWRQNVNKNKKNIQKSHLLNTGPNNSTLLLCVILRHRSVEVSALLLRHLWKKLRPYPCSTSRYLMKM